MGKKKHKSESSPINDEVEQLLQAAQDQLLLNLFVNSHTSSRSSLVSVSSSNNNFLNSDLDRRFQNLKSKDALEDDLTARFAALQKSCLISTPKSGSNSSSSIPDVAVSNNGRDHYQIQEDDDDDDDDDEEDEVEKLIQWAKDAARLDPSPPSDDSDDDQDAARLDPSPPSDDSDDDQNERGTRPTRK
ncbi:46 kDa FK506-binding nuclear protein-like isoform X2 [Quillaja saponaria]|uniref:46 kDa FK506-binding nuclear protein-like isoform X2 n=1 Tax=Quillaja saponaria TaxID=32244 RepID=A0AAD7PGF2_QUISA|nr:46 kDa FK506-binding nuclear protein-like isoform X2 [Quillaja saponaria]